MNAIIKAGRIAHLTDARYFAAKAVQYLGFNLEEGTDGYLDPMFMKAIREWVQGPEIVGEFRQTPIRTVLEAAAFYALDAIQLPFSAYADDLEQIRDVPLILEIEAGLEGPGYPLESLQKILPVVDIFLFVIPGQNIHFEDLSAHTDHWKTITSLRPSLLQADLGADEWPQTLEALGFAGLSLNGGAEEQTGVKSFDEIESILDKVLL